MNKQYLTYLAIAILVGGVSFFGGIKYQQSKSPSMGNFRGNGQFRGNVPGGNPMNGNQAAGNRGRFQVSEIISADDKSITIKLPDNSSKIIFLNDKTMINKASDGTKADLTVGTKVLVLGNANSDGSETAQSIQINPREFVRPSPPTN